MQRGSAQRGMNREPVAGDVDAAAEPDLIVPRDMVEEALQSGKSSRAAGQAAMETDRHHLGPLGAFRIENVESVAQIGKELLAAVEALRRRKTHVVGVERIGDYEVVATRHLHPIGQVVGIGIGVVEKAAVFGDEALRVLARAPGVPAKRPLAGEALDRGDGALEVLTLDRLRDVLVIDPTPAMTRHLVAELYHGARRLRIALERHADSKH